jgi:hypothetical protein
MTTIAPSVATAWALACLHAPAWAHEGHGLWGSHWHATDVLGFVVVVALALGAWVIGRRK